MALTNATAAFIGASVTLFLVIIFMILMVILVRQCLAFLAKRNAIRAQTEQQLQARRQLERQRRGSITEPVPATFDWHHSIRIAGTPPPSYHEAKGLPAFDETVSPTKKKRGRREREKGEGGPSEVIVTKNRSATLGLGTGESEGIDPAHRRHSSPNPVRRDGGGDTATTELENGGSLSMAVELENLRNSELMTSEGARGLEQVSVDIEGSFEVVSGEGEIEVNRSAVTEQVNLQLQQ